MPAFLFRAEIDPSKLDVRDATRPEHLAYQAGFVTVVGGPMTDVQGSPTGSVIVFEAASMDEARRRILEDPYMKAGVFAAWTLDGLEIRVWSSPTGAS